VPAYVLVTGAPATPRSINAEGLKRRGFTKPELSELSNAFKLLYRRGNTVEDVIRQLESDYANSEKMAALIHSLKRSTRGIVR